jgi:hypothetical protein
MTTITARTANGAQTNATSGTPVLDLFFTIGASRLRSEEEIRTQFRAAYAQDPELATRVGLWARDARGGAGERRAFRVIFRDLIEIDPDRAQRVLALIPELGRWDDVLVALETPLESAAVDLIASGLERGDRLCGKWMPRKGPQAARLRRALGMTPKGYRKTLVGLTSVVETQMCDNQWDNINYGSVPSVAHSRYRKAFGRHSPERYREYLDSIKRGEAKINAGAVMPYDIVRGVGISSYYQRVNLDAATADSIRAQWAALPDLGLEGDILPVIDVSGSMGCAVSGSTTAMDVAVSLGIYLSERIRGKFANKFVTFSDEPNLVDLEGDIIHKIRTVANSDWGMSTNIEAVFQLIVETARAYSLTQEDLPSKVLILSDMEFNQATGGGYWSGSSEPTNFEAIDAMFTQLGYQRPDLVFWNINGRSGNVPVTLGDGGTALVSGFSPNIARAVMGDDIDPESVMLTAVNNERYDH